jgi:hypothetical protein
MYRFNAIKSEITAGSFAQLEKLITNLYENAISPEQTKHLFKRTKLDLYTIC